MHFYVNYVCVHNYVHKITNHFLFVSSSWQSDAATNSWLFVYVVALQEIPRERVPHKRRNAYVVVVVADGSSSGAKVNCSCAKRAVALAHLHSKWEQIYLNCYSTTAESAKGCLQWLQLLSDRLPQKYSCSTLALCAQRNLQSTYQTSAFTGDLYKILYMYKV